MSVRVWGRLMLKSVAPALVEIRSRLSMINCRIYLYYAMRVACCKATTMGTVPETLWEFMTHVVLFELMAYVIVNEPLL